MVTGIETAGIVLAILPLVIEGLKAYLEGVRTIEKWWRFDRELANLVRILDAEYIRYLNTCEELLVGIVSPSTVGALLDSPSGDGWRAPDIEKKLRLRLRRSFLSFMETINDMENVVQQLVKKLGLDLDSKASQLTSQQNLMGFTANFFVQTVAMGRRCGTSKRIEENQNHALKDKIRRGFAKDREEQ
jgi:hypothetical protein